MSDLLIVDGENTVVVITPGESDLLITSSGPPGISVIGASAYELALSSGFIGTLEEWLVSLIGLPGAPIDISTLMTVIQHGSDANFPRPVGIGAGYWIGIVEPMNAIISDMWNTP